LWGIKMNSLFEAALQFAERGYSVIPITPGNKKPPLVKWEQYQKEKASISQIKEWWTKWPNANVAIVTGEISGFCVVDHDRYKPTYCEETALQYFPDSIVTATATSPQNGLHMYFAWPGDRIAGDSDAGGLKNIDFRCDGNYIVAPPSVNGNGKKYSWILDLRTTDLMPLPEAYKNKIISTLYGHVTTERDITMTTVTECDIWASGLRDKNLFHVAYCLTKTSNDEEYIRQTLRAIILSWGETDEQWINVKIKSAMDRQDRREKNVQAMVDEFISVTTGDFSVTYMDKELGFVTQRDMAAARKAISRRKDTLVEKAGTRDGWWRRIDTEIEYMDFNEPEGDSHPVLLPFDLHNLVKIFEGNIILISGEFNSGKSLFGLTTLVLNKNRMPIRYISSEMKVPEIKGRFKWFDIDRSCWMPDSNCKYLVLNNNLPALLLPDGLNIIDYLEFPDGDYTKASEYMKQVHNKLKRGIAIICIQHKVGAKLPRSGDLVMEKPRLAVALKKLDGNDDSVIGIAEILKAKHPKIGKMDGKKLKYEIKYHGSRFETKIDWGYWRM
jgi:hypothetical protein